MTTDLSDKYETPSTIAQRLCLRRDKPSVGVGRQHLTWDDILDLAVKAYWKRRDG